MDRITVPASITIEKGFSTQRYKWKTNSKKESVYRRPTKRAAVRFTSKNFALKINRLEKDKRQVSILFLNNSKVRIKRISGKGNSLQGYSGLHPFVQLIVNKMLPKEIWNLFSDSNKKTLTIPVDVEINLEDWLDVGLSPEDFLIDIEREAKSLLKKALKKEFKIKKVSKGRMYDLSLINPNGKEMVIAISSHVAKTNGGNKEKTIQKILMDISKLIPYLSENKAIPVIITRPIEFKNSWSFTTAKYLEFYNEKFGFNFLTTEFKKGWEDIIIDKLLKIKNVQSTRN